MSMKLDLIDFESFGEIVLNFREIGLAGPGFREVRHGFREIKLKFREVTVSGRTSVSVRSDSYPGRSDSV